MKKKDIPDNKGKNTYKELKQKVRMVFEENWVDLGKIAFHQPSSENYCSFFAWDSGWHIIVMSHIDPEKAFKELKTLYSMQTSEGHIPHETRIPELEKNEQFLRKILLKIIGKQYDSEGRSRFVDPPSYLLATKIYYDITKDERVFAFLPNMAKLIEFLEGERDLFGDGLISLIHPWESGTDASPVFDNPMDVDGSSFLGTVKYGIKYKRLIDKLDKNRWKSNNIKKNGLFALEDVGYNGILAAGILATAKLYKETGEIEKYEKYYGKAKKIIDAMEKHLWDQEQKCFYPRYDLKAPKLSRRTCANVLAPLLTGLVSQDKAEELIVNYLKSSDHFWCSYPVSYNSLKEARDENVKFDTPLLWRGACVWANMNWIAFSAAKKYGYSEISEKIGNKTGEMILKSGFREFYHPKTGEGEGAVNFTWAGLVLDMFYQLENDAQL